MPKFFPAAFLSLLFFTFSATFAAGKVSADNLGLVGLINTYRQSQGMGSLAEDQNLTNAACWMGNDMATHNYFDHVDSLSRDPFVRMDSFGVSGGSRAENIASITNQTNFGQTIFNLWKNSPGHNANMLGSSYNRIGVGFGYSSSTKTYSWVADFASGTASALKTACGAVVSPPPAPPPAPAVKTQSKPVPTPAPSAPVVQKTPEPATTQIATASTASAFKALEKISTKSATVSSKSAKNFQNESFKNLFLGILILGNLPILVLTALGLTKPNLFLIGKTKVFNPWL